MQQRHYSYITIAFQLSYAIGLLSVGRFIDWVGVRVGYTLTISVWSKPHTPAPLEADCLEVFETGRTLLATLGYSLFDPVGSRATVQKNDEVFYCKASGADGRGLYTEEGFVVLKGSVGRKQNVPSIQGTADERFRARLLSSGVMREDGTTVVFVKDHLFRKPSTAAIALMGRTANGWLDWKTADGRTLDSVKRQAPAS